MKRIKIFLLAAMLIGVAGCEDFLDINRDPNNPSEPNIRYMLPGIESSLGDIYSLDFGSIGYATSVFTHQLSTRQPEYDNYGITGSAYAVTHYWQYLYAGAIQRYEVGGVLQNIDLLIKLGEDSKNIHYAGVGKLLKAYVFSTIVDLWGDVPYTEANAGNLNPKFDKDQDIYTSLFKLIDEGIQDLQDETAGNNLLDPGSDDLIYNGDLDSWTRMANTLKLKLYTQVKDVDGMYDQTAVEALLAGDLIETWDESFKIPYGKQVSPDDRNPAFVSEWGGGQISNYISPWLFNIMNGKNDNILTGIVDPRIPYYWVNQLSPDKPDPENDPEFKDGYFQSIYFGSTGTNRDHAGRATFSMMGIYPCGGRYDDGKGSGSSGFSSSDGTGAAPCRLITHADRYYLEAELIASGKVNSYNNLMDVLETAMFNSFEQVNEVASGAAPATQVVPSISDADQQDYVDAIDSLFVNADNDRKLELIMTEKWLSSFGTSHDQYTDYRRTGYPVMFNPEDPNTTDTGVAGEMSGGPDGSGLVPVQQTRGYPVSWPYSNDEIQLNENLASQKADITTAKIFWDK